jgi:hypothetical protein
VSWLLSIQLQPSQQLRLHCWASTYLVEVAASAMPHLHCMDQHLGWPRSRLSGMLLWVLCRHRCMWPCMFDPRRSCRQWRNPKFHERRRLGSLRRLLLRGLHRKHSAAWPVITQQHVRTLKHAASGQGAEDSGSKSNVKPCSQPQAGGAQLRSQPSIRQV